MLIGFVIGITVGGLSVLFWMTRRLRRTNQIHFGSPDQWTAFVHRNQQFMDRIENLREAMNGAFNRDFTTEEQVDSFIFAAGHLAADDFLEILLLCANAEAFAAEKVLRGMFERVVTLKYLRAHPDEVDRYLNYYWITQHKLINAIETTFRTGLLDPAKVKEVEQNYQRVKDEYKGISWTPKDLITMAREVGMIDHIVPSYYMPMQQTHPTVKGMLDRLKLTADGKIVPDERLQPLHADRVLCAAHVLLLYALDAQIEHFRLPDELYKRAERDFIEIWRSRHDLHAGGTQPPAPPHVS